MTGNILSNKKFQKDWKISEKNSYFYKVSKLLHSENVKTFLYNFQKQFVIVPMNKAAKNLSYVCKQLYISKIFNEIGLNSAPNPPYKSMSWSLKKWVLDSCVWTKHNIDF